MNEVKVFSFGDTASVRTVTGPDLDAWFVAADVCEALEIVQTASAMRQLDEDEKDVRTMHTPGGEQQMTIINESGLYSLIFTSRKEEAKRFKKWVTSEVLPTIRKTGSYSHSDAALLQKLVHAQDKIIELQGDLIKKKSEQKTYAAQRHSSKKNQKEKILSMLKKDKETPMHAITKALHSTIEGLKDCMEELQQSGLIECKTEKPPRGRTLHLVRMV